MTKKLNSLLETYRDTLGELEAVNTRHMHLANKAALSREIASLKGVISDLEVLLRNKAAV